MFRQHLMWLLVTLMPICASGCALFYGPTDNRRTVPIVRNNEKEFVAPVCSWWALKRQNVVMQQHEYSCGAAALATISQYYWGDKKTEADFLMAILNNLNAEEAKERVQNGLSMTDLRRAAVKLGYLSSMGTRTLSELTEVKIPVIVRLKGNNGKDFEHFVVYRGIVDDRVFLADSIRGNLRISVNEFMQQWTDGAILVIVRKDTKPPESSPLTIVTSTPVQHELRAARRWIQLNTEPPVANPLGQMMLP